MSNFRFNINTAALFMLSMMGAVLLGMNSLMAFQATEASASQDVVSPGVSLRERLCFADGTIRGLTQSLIEARVQQDRLSDQLNEANDKLNLGGITSSTDAAQKMLLLLKRLRLVQQENDTLRKQLMSLSEATQAVVASESAPTSKDSTMLHDQLKKEIGAAVALLKNQAKKNNGSSQSADLVSGTILEVKPEWSFVVMNLGARHGVSVGAPFQVWRDHHCVGAIKVVDVRDTISGAIVQNSTKMHDLLRVGDQLHIDLIH